MNRTACVFFIISFHLVCLLLKCVRGLLVDIMVCLWQPGNPAHFKFDQRDSFWRCFFFKFHFELKSCVFFSLAAGFRGTHTRFCVMSIVIYLPAADSCGHVFAAAFSHSPSAPVFRNEIDDCRVTHCAQFAAPIRHSMSSIECMSLDFLCVFFIIIMISIEWTETHLFEASHQLWNSVNIKKQQQQQQS